MKILLKNISNTFNYGSMMMAENLITYLNKKINDLEFYIEAFTNEDVERLKKATNYSRIFCDKVLKIDLITKRIKYIRVLERKLRTRKHLIKAAKYYDAIIVLGGDDFSEIYYKFPKDNLEIKFVFDEIKTFNKYSKLFMIGQTIGPYSGTRVNMAKEAFENVKIYTRDDETTKYMKNIFEIETKTSRDLAFLDLNLQDEYLKNAKSYLKKHDLKENDYVTIVGTGLISKYCKEEKDMIDAFYNLIKRLKKSKEKIVCLSHVFTPDGINDNILYKKIDDKYNNYITKNCIVIDEKLLPVEARIILGFGKYTITCRMHAAVSTFQMGKPAICIAYSKKYKGVIADGLDMPEFVLDAKEEKFWDDFEEKIMMKVEFINKEKSIDKKIKKNVNTCKLNVIRTLDDICEELKKD